MRMFAREPRLVRHRGGGGASALTLTIESRTSENPKRRRRQGSGATTNAAPGRRRGRSAVALPAPYAAILETYSAALQTAPLSDQTRRTYTSKVRQFLAWLADADLDANPLASADGRDRAVRD